MIFINLLALVAGLSSWLSVSVLAQDGGLLQPTLLSTPRQCQNVTVAWTETPATSAGNQIYAVRVLNSSTAGMELAAEVPLTWLGHFSSGETRYNWRVAIPEGTSITLLITDQAGNRGYSAPSVVQNGSTRCLPKAYEPNYFAGSTGCASSSIASNALLLSSLLGAMFAAVVCVAGH